MGSNVIEFDAPDWADADLVGETVLGGAPPGLGAGPGVGVDGSGDAPDAVAFGRRASFGRPQSRPLLADDAALDAQTQQFIAATPGRFHIVMFLCSLEPGEREDLEAAALGVELSDAAVSWSMAPLRMATPRGGPDVSLELGVSLTPALQIKGTWAPDRDAQQCWVRALGVGESDPEWRLQATRDAAIRGPHAFTMVIHSPTDAPTTGRLRLTARFHRGGFRSRYRVDIAPAAAEFALAP